MELQTIFVSNSLNLLEKAMQNDTLVAKYSYLVDGTKLAAVNGNDCGFAYRGSFTYRTDAEANRVFESTLPRPSISTSALGSTIQTRRYLSSRIRYWKSTIPSDNTTTARGIRSPESILRVPNGIPIKKNMWMKMG